MNATGRRTPSFRLRFGGLAFVGLVAATMGFTTVSQADIRTLTENEGVVIGSIFVRVAEAPIDSSWRQERRLERTVWLFELEKENNPLLKRNIRVQPGVERHFVEKLRSGRYYFRRMSGVVFTHAYVPLGIHFSVTPQTITYLGRIEVTVPQRVIERKVSYRVVDAEAGTLEILKTQYPQYATEVTKRLVNAQSFQRQTDD